MGVKCMCYTKILYDNFQSMPSVNTIMIAFLNSRYFTGCLHPSRPSCLCYRISPRSETGDYRKRRWRRHSLKKVVCSTPLLAPRIGLYTASLVSLKDALIGWSASDYDAPTQLWRIQINTGYTLSSPTWRASPTWRKQKAFPLPGSAALWVF